jgi:hypothetical protein
MTKKNLPARKSSSTSLPEPKAPKVYDYDTLLKKVKAGYRRAKELYAAEEAKQKKDR